MANYLKDIKIVDATISLATLQELVDAILNFAAELNHGNPPEAPNPAIPAFVIRYDDLGERVFVREYVLEKFSMAKSVERIALTLETGESLRSSRAVGTYIELIFDPKNPNCFLTVSSDDGAWVDTKFSRLHAILRKTQNWNRWVRNRATELLVQCMGVVICFLLSLTVARYLAPTTKFENAFLLCFMFSFLLSANLWGYVQGWALGGIWKIFPNVRFVKAGREYLHWLPQALVGSIVLYLLNWIFDRGCVLVLEVLRPLFVPGVL